MKLKLYRNVNDPRSVIFVSHADKRYGTAYNFANPPKWRWLRMAVGVGLLGVFMLGVCGDDRLVRWISLLGISLCTFEQLFWMRRMAEKQLAYYPGPMGPRTSDGFDAAPDLITPDENWRACFCVMWVCLAGTFAVMVGTGIRAEMGWHRAILGALHISILLLLTFMFVEGCCELFGCFRLSRNRKALLLLPLWGMLLLIGVWGFRPVRTLYSQRTVWGTLPNGERIAANIPVGRQSEAHSGEGWKAYIGDLEGKSYLLIGPSFKEMSAFHIGHKGQVIFFSKPLAGDAVTIFNRLGNHTYHVRMVDGAWRIEEDPHPPCK